MKTIKLNSIGKDKYQKSDFDPAIGVSDSHLLVSSRPNLTGVFEVTGVSALPNTVAKSFRITNSGSTNVDVYSKSIIFSRQFDESSSFGLVPDSPSIDFRGVDEVTPLGRSQVLNITTTADTSLFSSVPVVPNVAQVTFTVYFKIKSLSADVTPLGIYTERASIDINYPAAAIRVKPDLSLVARVGYTDQVISGADPVTLNVWHRATILRTGTDFTVQVERYSAGSYIPLVPDAGTGGAQTFTSIGNALLDEIDNEENYVIAFASEGQSEFQVESLEIFKQDSGASETLIAGTTKEYFCHRTLDEYSVSGDVTGYYRS